MEKLPSDIENKINKLFTNEIDRVKAKELILGLWSEELNVGPEQLARSILTISGGDIEKIIEIKKDYGDPRDLIMFAVKVAEDRHSNPHYHFNDPFDDED